MNLEPLSIIFEEYKSLDLPRSNGVFKDQDTDLDLYLDDGYLCGLVDTFLKSKRPIESRLSQESITLNALIDFQLNAYQPASEKELEIIISFQVYRKMMMRLALALSQASGLPIEWR